jgi:hypothetical protein
VLEPTQLWLNLQESNGYTSDILFGALFLVVILFLPRGVIPTGAEYVVKARAWLQRRQSRQPAPAAGSTAEATASTAATGRTS